MLFSFGDTGSSRLEATTKKEPRRPNGAKHKEKTLAVVSPCQMCKFCVDAASAAGDVRLGSPAFPLEEKYPLKLKSWALSSGVDSWPGGIHTLLLTPVLPRSKSIEAPEPGWAAIPLVRLGASIYPDCAATQGPSSGGPCPGCWPLPARSGC